MGFWLVFLLWVGSFVLGELLRPKPKFNDPQPSGIGDFRVPTAEEGRAIPWLIGTCKVGGPNVVWYGDLEVRPIRKKVKTGLFSSTTITTGYQYFLGEQLGLCLGPVDAITDVLFDDKSVGPGAIIVEAGRNTMVFANTPPPYVTADVPPGAYATTTALAIATETAMDGADPGTWKVCYGFHLIPGRSAQLVYAVYGDFGAGDEATDITIDVGGVYLTGPDAARSIAFAMNAAERAQAGGARVEWTVDFEYRRGHVLFGFTALRGTVHGCYIRGIVDYDLSALGNLGFQMGVDHFTAGEAGTIEGQFEVREDRFTFAFGGTGGKLNLADAAFTAQDLFGLLYYGTPTMPVLATAARTVPGFIAFYAIDDDLTRIVINAPDLFGGQEREGGIVGTIDFYRGSSTQIANDYLEGVLQTRLPGYRHLCYAVFRHLYQGTSPYLKNPAFIIRRCPNSLELEDVQANLAGDANPIAALYELCTDTFFGAAIPTSLIDFASFQAAAVTVAGESTDGVGVSMIVDNQAAAGELATELLRHVDGVLFVDPFSGKITVKLARADYDPASLLLVDEDVYGRKGDASALEFSRPSWDETRNVVKVRFTDRDSNFSERIAQEQEAANIQVRGGQRSIETIDFRGLSNYTNAQRAAARSLKSLSYPLAAISFPANRKTWTLRPGGVFKLSSQAHGIVELPCRVTRVQPGTPEDGKIQVDAVEDVFGVDRPSYTAPIPGWTDPGVTPQALAAERLEEEPYGLGAGEDRRIMTMGAAGGTVIDGYQVWSDPIGGVSYSQTQTVSRLTPFASLLGGLGPAEDSLVLTGGDLSTLQGVNDEQFAAGRNLLLLVDEWIAWRDIVDNGNGSWTISHLARGCLDSTPTAHAAGDDVWFPSAGYGHTTDDPYGTDALVAAKLRTFRGAEAMALANAPRLILQLDSRGLRPAVPALVRINGEAYPLAIPATGDLTLEWAHRDRTAGGAYDVSNSTPSIESGTHYRVRVYGDGGTLKHTEDGLTDPGWIYTNAAELADNGDVLNAAVRIVIDAIQDAGDELVSRQAFDWSVVRGTLAPPPSLNASGRLLFRPTDFFGDGGTSTRGSGSSTIPVRNLPQVDDRTEVSTFVVPDDFTELVAIELFYCNTDTSTNDWVTRVGLRVLGDGDDGTAAPTFGGGITVTPPATQDQVDVVVYDLPGVALAAGDEVLLVIQRKAGGFAANDTNAFPMAIIGVRLSYA